MPITNASCSPRTVEAAGDSESFQVNDRRTLGDGDVTAKPSGHAVRLQRDGSLRQVVAPPARRLRPAHGSSWKVRDLVAPVSGVQVSVVKT